MKRGVLIGCLTMMTLMAVAAPDDLLTSASSEKARVLDARIEKMLVRVSRKTFDNDQEHLNLIFRKTQKEFLHRYRQYSDIDELAVGEFDCLTATSLFAEILERSGFKFRIMETNYHIFLLVTTTQGEVLIETTDRFEGFVTSEDAIAKKIDGYRKELPAEKDSKVAYQYSFDLYNEISQAELSGLLYFNQAVKAFNNGTWQLCSERLVLADCYCDSPRIDALASLLLCTISLGDVSEDEKAQVLRNLKKFESIAGQAIASR
jgi:hypothetical protein